jgi:histidinol-phosphate aminotransferase
VEAVDVLRQPFFCNSAAQAAAVEALKHGDAVAQRVEDTIVARVEMEEQLRALGLRVADSEANFAWISLPDDAQEPTVIQGLTEHGVLVRAGTALGRENTLRVTYGTPEQNARFVAALADTLAL